MKKILGILVVAMLCVCMLVPTASAALSDVELDEIAGGVDVEELEEMEAALDKYLANDSAEADDTTKAAAATNLLDLSWLTSLLTTDTSAITDMLSGFDASNLDSLLAVVSESMSGAGIDLANFDLSALGSFDITSVLSSTAALSGGETQDLAATVTNLTAGLAETLKSGLTALGLDTATIEGILDNDIVNFFANMYIGFIGEVEEETTAEETTKETTTKKPAVVTTETPKTGDTSAVVVAMATLAVASAAAVVCLKKKED
ncbi:MAG: hypothetical protein IJN88_09875 [Clostridia bacterium]|nr:hypothetical protein [Clostridia bacterium]